MSGSGPGPFASGPHRPWRARDREIPLDRPVVLGILNLTPDSFSDGGDLVGPDGALARGREMVAAGASILDVGGESTRPGAAPVEPSEEIRRVVPAIEALAAALEVPISVDTRKAEVARAALAAGASIVNDVSALAFDPGMAEAVRESGAGCILMHMRRTPADMVEYARYEDVVGEVARELGASAERALAAGIERDRIVLDPGIGFAKTAAQSVRLLGGIARLADLGFPVLVGPSRKSFLGELLGVPPKDRAVGTVAACVMAYLGGARIFRVHDVAAVRQALVVAEAIARERDPQGDRPAPSGTTP